MSNNLKQIIDVSQNGYFVNQYDQQIDFLKAVDNSEEMQLEVIVRKDRDNDEWDIGLKDSENNIALMFSYISDALYQSEEEYIKFTDDNCLTSSTQWASIDFQSSPGLWDMIRETLHTS